jgi:hypothetical protein
MAITTGSIRAYARSCRVDLSAAQIDRWRELDLLGPYLRPGRGRGKGRRVLYQPGARRFAVFLARQLKDTKSLNVVGWRAWLAGHPVTAFARRRLEATLQVWEREALLILRLERPLPGREGRIVKETRRDTQSDKVFAMFLGLTTLRGLPISYAEIFRRAVPQGSQIDADMVAEKVRLSFSVTSLRAMLATVDDGALECVRDTLLLIARVADRYVPGLEGRWTEPPVMLLGLAIAWTRLDADFPSLGQVIRQELVHGFRTLSTRDLSPDEESLFRAAREMRKEIRRERRRAKLL